ERGHASEPHHHLRVDIFRTRRHANPAARTHTDPAERLGRALLAAQHRQDAGDGGLRILRWSLGVLRHRAYLVALAALRARAEDPLHLRRLEFLQPLADEASVAHINSSADCITAPPLRRADDGLVGSPLPLFHSPDLAA